MIGTGPTVRDQVMPGVFEYLAGLLHTKSLTVDGQVTLIGSANVDRHSFELSDENNILFYNRNLTVDVRRRLWNNTVAVLGPVLERGMSGVWLALYEYRTLPRFYPFMGDFPEHRKG